MDDFGTGYSSLSYLKQLPLDTLKIDRSFIQNVDSNAVDAAIVSAIFAMAESLWLRVVAEGVETCGQLQVLGRYGCAYAQGYYFSKPLPAEACRKLLTELAALVAGRSVNGRPIEVRPVRTVQQAHATQVLFVSADEDDRYTAMRDELADSPVLTVGESPSFSVTGAIGFVQEGDKLRFEINAGIAERSHLKISAQLQKLAVTVRRTH